MLPHPVVAGYWAPLLGAVAVTAVLVLAFVLWHRAAGSTWSSSAAAALSLLVTAAAAALTPADVFLVSAMKFPNGTYREWAATAAARADAESEVLRAYYALYGALMALLFLVLPLVFFYHLATASSASSSEAMEGEAEAVVTSPLWSAVKWTSVSVLAFAALVLVGVFVPWGDVNLAGMQLSKTALHAQNLMVFLLNALSVVGMLLLIVYTGYGMTALPAGLLCGDGDGVHAERRGVEAEIAELERQIAEIRERHEAEDGGDGDGGRPLPHFDQVRLERLEQQLRLLNRTRHDLEQTARTAINRIIRCCRPFQVVFGVLLSLLGLLLLTSLLLQAVDRALHSLGPRHGYVVRNGSLPDPVDALLVYAQVVFPLDYLVYGGLALYFAASTVAGVKRLGIPFLWLGIYKIRSGRTKPEALSLLCGTLILIQLALNVVLFSVAPDYTAYGSQHYHVNASSVSRVVVRPCSLESEQAASRCDMTRIASLLMAFHSNAWIFPAIYYWLGWALIVVVMAGAAANAYLGCSRRRRRWRGSGDADQLLDDDNPFGTEDDEQQRQEVHS